MSLLLLGVDFRQAALDVRAALSYDADATRALLARARDVDGLDEIALLSTCNRTEFYLVTRPGGDAAARWLQVIREDRRHAPIADPACLLVRHEGAEAAAHLFAVAAGVASALLGDVHVAGQVKAAYALACEAGTAGPLLHRVFQQALRVAKRCRRETALGRGHVSIGACVAQLLAHDVPSGRRVAVMGTGTVATDVARYLGKHGHRDLTVVSRDPGRAAALAAHVGARTARLGALEEWLSHADVVIAATRASAPVLTAAMLSASRPDAPQLVVDLGVPRNVAADVEARLLTIDDVRMRRDAALAAREAAVPAARRLVDEAVGQWRTWQRERVVVPAIATLYAQEAAWRQDMLARLVGTADRRDQRLERRLRLAGRQRVHRHVVALRTAAAGIPGASGVPVSRDVTVQG